MDTNLGTTVNDVIILRQFTLFKFFLWVKHTLFKFETYKIHKIRNFYHRSHCQHSTKYGLIRLSITFSTLKYNNSSSLETY